MSRGPGGGAGNDEDRAAREGERREIEALVARSREGERAAFDELVRRRRDLVFRVAFQQVRDPEAAKSVTQAVFVQLWRKLDRYDPSRRFDTWLHQVTVNAAIDHHRRGARRRRESSLDEALQLPDAAGADGPAAERRMRSLEVARILHELTRELPERQRAAFLLREAEGLTSAEVAEALGTSESTVRNHVLQARRTLRAALVERYPEYAPTPRGDDPESEG